MKKVKGRGRGGREERGRVGKGGRYGEGERREIWRRGKEGDMEKGISDNICL